MLGQSGKAAAFLLAAGFFGGFCLTKGSAHLMAPRFATIKEAGGAGEQAGGMSGSREGSGSERETGGDGAEREGKEKPEGTAPAAEKAVAEASAPPLPPPSAVSDLLAGNTLSAVKDDITLTRYLDRAGWQAVETRPGLLTVKHWAVRNGELCEVTGTILCEPVVVAPEKSPAAADGAVLGTATLAGLRWTVRRGRPDRMPAAIPLIDDGPVAAQALGSKATQVGDQALRRFVGRTLLAASGAKGDRYEPDGRWVAAKPLLPGEAPSRAGVLVSVGHWLGTGGKLCLDAPGLELSRVCYRPEQWGPDTLRLVADRTGAVTTLVANAAR